MRWEFTAEQAMFQQAFGGWLGRVAEAGAVRGWQDAGDPAPFERALAGENWLGVGTPEDIGGQGGGLIELALAAQELGASAAPSSGWLATVLAIPALAGLPELTARVFDQAELATLVVPSDGPPDVRSARPISYDGARVSGSVPMVLGADRARHLIVAVPLERRSGLVLVDAQHDGVTVSPRRLLDRSRTVADVVLDSAHGTRLEIDAEQVLAQAAVRSAVLVSADALGAMTRMLDLATAYAAQRHQFGVPIGSFQAVKHAAAAMLVSVEAARSIVYFAAASVQGAHEEAGLHAAVAKAQVCADAGRCADTALTLHGAIGYTWEYDLQLFYKRAKLDGFLFGSPAVWNERLATALPLLPPGDDLAALVRPLIQ